MLCVCISKIIAPPKCTHTYITIKSIIKHIIHASSIVNRLVSHHKWVFYTTVRAWLSINRIIFCATPYMIPVNYDYILPKYWAVLQSSTLNMYSSMRRTSHFALVLSYCLPLSGIPKYVLCIILCTSSRFIVGTNSYIMSKINPCVTSSSSRML